MAGEKRPKKWDFGDFTLKLEQIKRNRRSKILEDGGLYTSRLVLYNIFIFAN